MSVSIHTGENMALVIGQRLTSIPTRVSTSSAGSGHDRLAIGRT
ncbi:MAG: hypothetical protein R3D03_18820 [Geminicoccaceae bacterium]